MADSGPQELRKLNMNDMFMINYGLEFTVKILHLDYRQLYLKTFYINFDPPISFFSLYQTMSHCHIIVYM